MSRGNKKTLLIGDSNIDTLDEKGRAKMESITLPHGYKILSHGTTRKGITSSTALDNVIANSNNIEFIKNIDPGISDHAGQLVAIHRTKEKGKFPKHATSLKENTEGKSTTGACPLS
jgi:hypothetical protein